MLPVPIFSAFIHASVCRLPETICALLGNLSGRTTRLPSWFRNRKTLFFKSFNLTFQRQTVHCDSGPSLRGREAERCRSAET
ncbi:hypothetical protein BJV77DRAFT_360514 [Russula vinacea]|nr:hypothetical protein BJV77DRAFT_360514 [Russula vinacea]